MLRVDKLSLSFRGVRALDGVDLSVDDHEIVGIIGPNGSGKSTLFNVISGVYRADGGDVHFDGKSIKGLGPTEIVGRGMARTFQNKRLFGSISVLENVMVAAFRHQTGSAFGEVLGLASGRQGAKDSEQAARECLELVGLSEFSQCAGTRSSVRRSEPPRNRARAGGQAETFAAGRTGGRAQSGRAKGNQRSCRNRVFSGRLHSAGRARCKAGYRPLLPHHRF